MQGVGYRKFQELQSNLMWLNLLVHSLWFWCYNIL